MNSRRSYLDALNAGRERRPQTTLDQLNQSLATLEQRLRRSQEEEPARPDRIEEERQAPPPGGRDDSLRGMAREVERARIQEDGAAAAGRIAGEIKGLRDDVHQQGDAQRKLASSLRGEFDSLRRDIELAPKHGVELNAEFERLSTAIHALGERGEDKGVSLLRQELEQVKATLDKLAREDSVNAVTTRWNAFEKRLGEFEIKMETKRLDPAIEALSARLEAMHRSLADLPSPGMMESFEQKLRALGLGIEQIALNKGGFKPEALAVIEERLDEITRAILASAVSPPPSTLNPEPFERIEAHVSAVSRQVEALRASEPFEGVMQRLAQLSARVDDLAAKANLPAKAVEQLASQIAIIAAKLDQVGTPADPDFVFKAIEQRFDTLGAMLERRQGDVEERGKLLFRDLERRLDEVVDRLEAQRPRVDPAEQNAKLMGALDARFDDFARRMESRPQPAAAMPAAEAKVIRDLEAQLAALTGHLAKPAASEEHLQAIAPRLDGIERSLAQQQDAVMQAAREAAENATRTIAGSNADKDAVAGFTQDLKALESLTRRSDERNARTFEAIHDTLIKIVDRLGAFEATGVSPASAADAQSERRTAITDAPSLDMEAPPGLGDSPAQAAAWPGAPAGKSERSPAEAASAAAIEALGEDNRTEAEQAGSLKRSMLGGLTRALGSKRKDKAAADAPSARSPGGDVLLDLDEPLDLKAANRPIEPGSGGPDLNAIMRRVRDERGQAPRAGTEADAAKSDFIAAARRAAQAAAAEAEVLKRQSDSSAPSGGLKIGDVLRRHRKSVMLGVGALALALTGVQAGKAFLSDDAPVEVASAMPAPSDELAPVVEADAAPAPRQKDDVASPQAEIPPALPVDRESETATVPSLAPAAAMAPPGMPAAKSDRVAADAETPASTAGAPAARGDKLPPAEVVSSAAPDAVKNPRVPEAIGPAALRQAAASGDAKAFWEIASRFADGRGGVGADPVEAAKWFEAAAGLGLAPAQYRIGSIYEKGAGVGRDVAKAESWYTKAADAGNASAMHNLAVLYAMGADGAADNASAIRWFRQAADRGVKDSQFNLGILAAKGVGMPQDLEESYKWFALVAKTGDKDAASKRDEIAHAIKPDALKRARAAAELWKAKPLDPAVNGVEVPDAWTVKPAVTAEIAKPAVTAGVDMKAAVRTIQLILQKNGYEAGGTDGVMGAKTKAAIIAFQKDNRLTPNGEVDDKLVKALLARK